MIRFENVTKRYRGTKRPALSDVDFNIETGEFVFLVGASGSGKSTCLRLILREEVPSTGRVAVLGRDLRSLANRKVPYFRRHIGSVFQDFRLLSSKTVAQNVAFSLQVIGSSRGFIHQAVPEALALVGLEGKAKRMPHELSGGEQQRVAIARAIVNRPKILLADEPTGNLDPATSVGIMQLLARINAGGTTVVMATHEAGFVDQMQRRVIELKNGEMVRDEVGGGYGDTSSIPRLQPEDVRGAAAAAALTAVQQVQRETAQAAPDAPTAPASVATKPAQPEPQRPSAEPKQQQTQQQEPQRTVQAEPAASDQVTTAPTGEQVRAPEPPTVDTPPEESASSIGPRTNPIIIPEIEVAELGMADRLGLSDDDTDEVGPTS